MTLSQVRDELLPGVWARDKDGTADLQLDYMIDSIVLTTPRGKHVLCTRNEIEDNTYKALIAPRLDEFLGGKK